MSPDKVTKQFFSCHNIFFLADFFLAVTKMFLQEKKSCGKKKIVLLLRGIFLATEIISVGEENERLKQSRTQEEDTVFQPLQNYFQSGN